MKKNILFTLLLSTAPSWGADEFWDYQHQPTQKSEGLKTDFNKDQTKHLQALLNEIIQMAGLTSPEELRAVIQALQNTAENKTDTND